MPPGNRVGELGGVESSDLYRGDTWATWGGT